MEMRVPGFVSRFGDSIEVAAAGFPSHIGKPVCQPSPLCAKRELPSGLAQLKAFKGFRCLSLSLIRRMPTSGPKAANVGPRLPTQWRPCKQHQLLFWLSYVLRMFSRRTFPAGGDPLVALFGPLGQAPTLRSRTTWPTG
jgi:hypothetical protein